MKWMDMAGWGSSNLQRMLNAQYKICLETLCSPADMYTLSDESAREKSQDIS